MYRIPENTVQVTIDMRGTGEVCRGVGMFSLALWTDPPGPLMLRREQLEELAKETVDAFTAGPPFDAKVPEGPTV